MALDLSRNWVAWTITITRARKGKRPRWKAVATFDCEVEAERWLAAYIAGRQLSGRVLRWNETPDEPD